MGPLAGIRIVEMSNIGPAPFAAMLLADMGAQVLRIARSTPRDIDIEFDTRFDLPNRSKQAVAVDLKSAEGVDLVKRLIGSADMLIEGYRPGVMERLGLGPDICAAINPRLIYGRMTGWGQQGALAERAGHDINYIAMTGALAAIGPRDGPPTVPLNLVGDFGGGALYLAMGMLAALHEARSSGQGQVVDAAMVDGSASLMAMHLGFRQAGIWHNRRGANMIDGGAPYYTTYRTSDGGYMAVGAIEKRFYGLLLAGLELDPALLPDQNDQSRWPEAAAIIAARFATRTRDEWTGVFAQIDACVSPVLDMDQSLTSPLAIERGLYVDVDGVTHPAPAPRFGRSRLAAPLPPADPARDAEATLADWGVEDDVIARLIAGGHIGL